MEGPRPCTIAELPETTEMLDLIFRVSRGFPPPMSNQHPYLYNPRNVDRMHIIKEEGSNFEVQIKN